MLLHPSRYIYGFEIDFELAHLYESYLAADKYLLHHFSKALTDYVKAKLSAESSCLIYDQLIKIGEREGISLASVRTTIIENSLKAFESEHFTQIDQETLISLLSLDELNIAEIDLLAAVSKWIDCEVQRQELQTNRENRRKVFEPIKGYIVFTALTPDQIASRKEVAELLTLEERGTVLLHQLDADNPSLVMLKTARRAGSGICSVFVNDAHHRSTSYYDSPALIVNRRVFIRTIYTTYSRKAEHMCFKILDSKGLDLGLKIEKVVRDGRLCLSFDSLFDVQPNTSYTLEVTGNGSTAVEDHLSKQLQLNFKGLVIFDLEMKYDFHCVKGFDFSF